jgi:hypothetical protein
MRTLLAATATLLALASSAHAQYTEHAGRSAPMDKVARPMPSPDGTMHMQIVEQRPEQDRFGNAVGNTHDLAIDGAFDGQTVAVIQLYTMESNFDFALPRAALKEKGFSVYRWSNGVPTPAELEKGLAKSSQLWIIANETHQLTPEHLKVIKAFFDAGHGVYIWGDNEPYYADANYVADALFGASMEGNLMGDQPVGLEKTEGGVGIVPNHLLTTGLEHIYEGITIATIHPGSQLEPLIYGSAGNLVTAYYDHDGKRAVLDGGFTRLYNKWDTAGTARYVKNAAAWLVNAERFGDEVLNPALRGDKGAHMVASIPAMPTTAPATAPSPTAAHASPETTRPTTLRAIGGLALAVAFSIGVVIVVPRMRRRG